VQAVDSKPRRDKGASRSESELESASRSSKREWLIPKNPSIGADRSSTKGRQDGDLRRKSGKLLRLHTARQTHEVREDESGRWRGVRTDQAVVGSTSSGSNPGRRETGKETSI
jgi:hypothetical protein